ncbi:MAG TPA: ScyD/ScyE family protein [Solirubrobacteraceae bacterium]|nr:ScyD/ScyE family protein [Solirubrobacteraceae bacterium]
MSSARVVADHLDNPRGLFLDASGALWVAEAGRAGKHCANGTCYGLSGAILRIKQGQRTVFAGGLPSIRDSLGTLGADDISVAPDRAVFTAMITDNAMLPARVRKTTLRGELGKLLRFGAHGHRQVAADVEGHIAGLAGVGHPYAVLALAGHQLVTDSELNRLIEVRGHRTRVIFHFPPGFNGADSVPTSLARGPDGAVYIGELSGVAAGPGHARIWRMAPGQEPSLYADGFNAIIGLAFGPDGSLYVCEFSRDFAANDPHGDVIRIAPDGTRTTLGAGVLFRPGGIAVARDGTVYVSNWSTLTGTPTRAGHRGQIVALTP